MLLAEDLLLLVTDDGSGQLTVPAAQVDSGLGGANLVELALMNKVDLSVEGEDGRPGRVVVRDPSPAGDDVLDAALAILAANQGKKPSAVIRPLSKNLRQALYERLAAAGVIRAERGKILGIFPTHTWPAQDASHEAQVRELLTPALVHQTAPDTRTAALIALLHALRCEHKIIESRALRPVQAAARGAGRADRPGRLGVRGGSQGDRRDERRGDSRHHRRHDRHLGLGPTAGPSFPMAPRRPARSPWATPPTARGSARTASGTVTGWSATAWANGSYAAAWGWGSACARAGASPLGWEPARAIPWPGVRAPTGRGQTRR